MSRGFFPAHSMGGITYHIPCPSCGRIHEITTGVSMLCTPPALTVSSLHNGGRPLLEYLVGTKRLRTQTFSLLDQGYALDPGYGYRPHYCPRCKRILTRFHFTLTSPDGQSWEPDYRCWRCRGGLTCIMQDSFTDLEVLCPCGTVFHPDPAQDPAPEEWS